MKHTLRLSLLFVSFFCLSASRAQTANPDTMIRKLFATLPANDQDGFVALYPNPQQLIELVKNIMASDEVKSQMALSGQKINMDSLIQAQVAMMSKPEMMSQMTKGFGQAFQRGLENGKQKNIDWKKARFVSYTLDTAMSGANKDEAMLQKLGYRTMNGVIDFSVDTALYQMQFSKIIFIPKENGWYGGEFGQIVRKGEKFSSPDEPMLNDTTVSVDTTPPPVKAKTKTSRTKAKTKSKPAARKPSTKS